MSTKKRKFIVTNSPSYANKQKGDMVKCNAIELRNVNPFGSDNPIAVSMSFSGYMGVMMMEHLKEHDIVEGYGKIEVKTIGSGTTKKTYMAFSCSEPEILNRKIEELEKLTELLSEQSSTYKKQVVELTAHNHSIEFSNGLQEGINRAVDNDDQETIDPNELRGDEFEIYFGKRRYTFEELEIAASRRKVRPGDVLRSYIGGLTIKQMKSKYNCSTTTIRLTVKKNTPREYVEPSDNVKMSVIKLRERGLSADKTGQLLGMETVIVKDMFEEIKKHEG